MLNGNQVAEIEREWDSPRWRELTRPYSAEDVARLRGTVKIEHTLARLGGGAALGVDEREALRQGFGRSHG